MVWMMALLVISHVISFSKKQHIIPYFIYKTHGAQQSVATLWKFYIKGTLEVWLTVGAMNSDEYLLSLLATLLSSVTSHSSHPQTSPSCLSVTSTLFSSNLCDYIFTLYKNMYTVWILTFTMNRQNVVFKINFRACIQLK